MDNKLKEIVAATDTDGGIGEEMEAFNIKLVEDGDTDGQDND